MVMQKIDIEHWVFILDRATPHNNVLINEIVKDGCIDLTICYAIEEDKARYNWVVSPTHEIKKALIYGKKLNLPFLAKCVFSKKSKFIIVGWANVNTILLHVLFFLFRKKYNHWSDLPDLDAKLNSVFKSAIRWSAYWFLRNSYSTVFGVGKTSVLGFQNLGFKQNRIVNLPIFINLSNSEYDHYKLKEHYRKKGMIKSDKFILLAGSRLVYEKGFDLLINAFKLLPRNLSQNICLVIVGSGEEFENLNMQVIEYNLQDSVIFTGWLEIMDFINLMKISDVFVHPARFDSYGGTIYAMSESLPVIGSTKAGAAVDRIVHGINGFLYHPNDVESLSSYISLLYKDNILLSNMRKNARETAMSWPPKRGVQILKDNLI